MISSRILAVIFLISSEVMIFVGLLSAFLILKSQQMTWPPIGVPSYPVLLTGLNTFFLFLSAVSLNYFVKLLNTKNNLHNKDFFYFFGALFLGLLFLLLQGYEWGQLIQYGVSLTGSVYGGIFTIIVGFHGIHVFAAIIFFFYLGLNLKKICRNEGFSESKDSVLHLMRIYWWFVTIIWPFIYLIVYF